MGIEWGNTLVVSGSMETKPLASGSIADSWTEEKLNLQELLGFGQERLGLSRGFLEEHWSPRSGIPTVYE